MQSLLTNALFDNIQWLYLAIALPVIIGSAVVHSIQCRAAAIVLTLMIVAAWQPSLWASPSEMMVMHALFMLPCLRASLPQIRILFAIVIVDIAWVFISEMPPSPLFMQFPTHLYWWHTAVNLLFLAQLYYAGRECYTVVRGHQTEDTDHGFLAVRHTPKGQS